jgi:hypothetical protein
MAVRRRRGVRSSVLAVGVSSVSNSVRAMLQGITQPQYRCAAAEPRTLWSLAHAFGHSLKRLGPTRRMRATEKTSVFFAELR